MSYSSSNWYGNDAPCPGQKTTIPCFCGHHIQDGSWGYLKRSKTILQKVNLHLQFPFSIIANTEFKRITLVPCTGEAYNSLAKAQYVSSLSLKE